MCLVKETFVQGTNPKRSLSWMFFGYDPKLRGWSGMYPVDGNPGLMQSAQRWNLLVLPKVDTVGWPTSWKFKCQRDRFLVVGVMGSRCCCPRHLPITYIRRLQCSSKLGAYETPSCMGVVSSRVLAGLDFGVVFTNVHPRNRQRLLEVGIDTDTVWRTENH